MSSERGNLGVAVIGAGPFGAKRARSVAAHSPSRLVVVADCVRERAQALASECGCEVETDWQRAVERSDVDAVIVSTPTPVLAEISLFAIKCGKHTLTEKPFARTPEEARTLVEAAHAKGVHLKAGYNHRYHPAIRRAHELFTQGSIGRTILVRCIYGHGGRPGYDREWRARADLSGGGVLMDQGVHLLDLLGWFAGDFQEVAAMISTAFWPMSPVEDNVCAVLRSNGGAVAELHASWTEWKNTFRFEVFGDHGYLRVTGLGASYGPETLCVGVREKLGEVPREQSFVFAGPDESLIREWEAFAGVVVNGDKVESDGLVALRTLLLAEAIYRAAKEGRTARLAEDRAVLSNPVTASG